MIDVYSQGRMCIFLKGIKTKNNVYVISTNKNMLFETLNMYECLIWESQSSYF